ncbi:hypothetical protein CsatB_023629 [Cannabis sativa]|uniref:Uncharacterized protein n=1 Tax=Cannabis sativa TaxID=3483 RepID=A0A803QZW3_CANSA
MKMAMVQYKCLLIATLILFCSFSITAKARILKEGEHVAKKSNDNELKPNQDRELFDNNELVAMDYSPAGKTPPIHN